MSNELKQFNPADFEDKWYAYWLQNNLFAPVKSSRKETYTIVIPPPNVTAVLHMGHGLNNTIQDILIRFKRMQGYETLWVPGTDHAGIATQNIVEKELAKEGKKRSDFTREKFVDRVWETALKHQKSIISQLKKMGCSADWNHNSFTLDEKLSMAVKKVFIELYNKGLIYKSKYIVNWCPRCSTALSDDEVNHKESNGKIWHIKYPVKDSKEFVVVATTRPETLLGDTAVAFNDNDQRYLHLKDKQIVLPLVNRELKTIYDSYVDPSFGTGAVKVTPAHDPNDFEMGRRHNLDFINIFNKDASTNDSVPERYRNIDRYECRKRVLEDLDKLGLLLKTENHRNAVGECYRCSTVVEPSYSDQWFVKMKPLAEKAIKAVKDKKIELTPKKWEKVYFNWLNNIKDWCISRQLWWGHRIPVYYCNNCNTMTASENTPAKCDKCGSVGFTQEADVLDTWFSSWLWPFSTLGWPNQTDDLKKFYPTSTLVTGPDIIFFWVARMIMAGLEFMGDVPFTKVFFTGMVMDLKGRKMSKSLGNGIDPFEVIERHGADALRYTMVAIVSPNQNIKLGFPKDKDSNEADSFDIGSKFANKIWNASKYIIMNIPEEFKYTNDPDTKYFDVFDSWIISELNRTVKNVTANLEKARFNDAATDLNRFFWNEFCDKYIELSKSKIFSNDKATKERSLTLLIYILKSFLKLLHPIMPFITEELFQKLPSPSKSIMTETFPLYNAKLNNSGAEEKAAKFFGMISLIRNIRGEMKVPQEKKIEIIVKTADKDLLEMTEAYEKDIIYLVRGQSIQCSTDATKPESSAAGTDKYCEVYINLEGLIDKDKEIARLQKELQKITVEYERTKSKLNNESFVSKAPKDVIEKEKKKLEEFEMTINKMNHNITEFK